MSINVELTKQLLVACDQAYFTSAGQVQGSSESVLILSAAVMVMDLVLPLGAPVVPGRPDRGSPLRDET
jgi:hypothetical protein